MHKRKQRDKAFWAYFTLGAEIRKECCYRIREALTFEKTHDVATTTATPVVLDLLLLYLVEQIKRLVIVSGVGAPEVCALEQSNLTCFGIAVLVKQNV